MSVVALLAVPASAAATHDSWQTPEQLERVDSVPDDNTGATVQAHPSYPGGEPLTAVGPGYCNNGNYVDSEPPPAGSVYMGATLWYAVTGTGGPMTLSTEDSDIDTVMAVYGPLSSDFRCDDDGAPTGLGSEITFNARAGVRYLIQVGGLVSGGVPDTGEFTLDVTAAPVNDARGAARTVDAGTTTPADNLAATVEGGELTSCGTAPFGRTVWFRWTAPATGDAVFVASDASTDTVLGVYAAGGGRLGCSDDAVGSGFSSRVAQRVTRGQAYEIQVGGYGAGDSADQGNFNLGVEFTPDNDVDDDGSSPPRDCNDENREIHPNAKDVRNGIDDNCDGVVDPDMDGDEHLRPPLGHDCDDNDPRVHPGATDVRGNRLNEDCVGGPAPFRRIGADVRLRGVAGNVFKVTALLVQDVPRGASVRAVCKPGCGTGRAATAAGTKRVTGISKRLRPGSVISVRVTRRGYIGFFQKLTIRAFAAPRYARPMCLMPGSRKPRRTCPGVR